MKRIVRAFLAIFCCLIIVVLGLIIYINQTTFNVNLDESKLINVDQSLNFYDIDGNFLFKDSGKQAITELEKIPKHVQNAFIAVEDKRFYSHNGVDYHGLARAIISNIKSFSFKEGGSTISQQLIKNTHLSNDKTFKRKFSEIKLARQLEKKYNKKEILEKYLNSIYFGENCYGITSASKHYFNVLPENMTLNQGAILAGMIKAPASYSPRFNSENCYERKNLVLKQMKKQGYITEKQYLSAKKQTVTQELNNKNYNHYDYFYLVRKEYNNLIKNSPYILGNVNVYTNFVKEDQEILNEEFAKITDNYEKSAILINKNGNITAYYSTCGEIKRQVGSTIKPILVYAPAIENDVVYSCSPILDEKTDFNGYSPSNFGDEYHGFVSVKDSLAKSLNVCAVKLLNYTGIKKAKTYINKTGLKLSENDNSLGIALGSTEKGATLTELCSAYTPFLNDGYFVDVKTIKRIELENGRNLFLRQEKNNKVFSEDTTSIVNDMMESCVVNGTAKKLSFINIPLCSKTGTVGNKKGNSDAYNLSYNSEKLLGVWMGTKDASLMSNSITGGTLPTVSASNIWNKLYKNKIYPDSYNRSDNVIEKYIDKIDFEQNHNVSLVEDFCLERNKIKTIFKKNKLPKTISTRYSKPKIERCEISVYSNGIMISLCLIENINAQIYRNNILVYDTKNNNKEFFFDKRILPNTEYCYSVIPYFEDGHVKRFGERINLKKVKTSIGNLEDWWNN